jgi:hypothetical protein
MMERPAARWLAELAAHALGDFDAPAWAAAVDTRALVGGGAESCGTPNGDGAALPEPLAAFLGPAAGAGTQLFLYTLPSDFTPSGEPLTQEVAPAASSSTEDSANAGYVSVPEPTSAALTTTQLHGEPVEQAAHTPASPVDAPGVADAGIPAKEAAVELAPPATTGRRLCASFTLPLAAQLAAHGRSSSSRSSSDSSEHMVLCVTKAVDGPLVPPPAAPAATPAADGDAITATAAAAVAAAGVGDYMAASVEHTTLPAGGPGTLPALGSLLGGVFFRLLEPQLAARGGAAAAAAAAAAYDDGDNGDGQSLVSGVLGGGGAGGTLAGTAVTGGIFGGGAGSASGSVGLPAGLRSGGGVSQLTTPGATSTGARTAGGLFGGALAASLRGGVTVVDGGGSVYGGGPFGGGTPGSVLASLLRGAAGGRGGGSGTGSVFGGGTVAFSAALAAAAASAPSAALPSPVHDDRAPRALSDAARGDLRSSLQRFTGAVDLALRTSGGEVTLVVPDVDLGGWSVGVGDNDIDADYAGGGSPAVPRSPLSSVISGSGWSPSEAVKAVLVEAVEGWTRTLATAVGHPPGHGWEREKGSRPLGELAFWRGRSGTLGAL